MATRYCGKVKISMKLVPAPHMPHGEQYRCALSVGGKRRGTVYVGIPRSLEHAIDSPKAYDETASAACAFAEDEGKIDSGDLDYTSSGVYVRRAKKYSQKDLRAGGVA